MSRSAPSQPSEASVSDRSIAGVIDETEGGALDGMEDLSGALQQDLGVDLGAELAAVNSVMKEKMEAATRRDMCRRNLIF